MRTSGRIKYENELSNLVYDLQRIFDEIDDSEIDYISKEAILKAIDLIDDLRLQRVITSLPQSA